MIIFLLKINMQIFIKCGVCKIKINIYINPGYDTKQSDGEAPVMLELWEMRNTPSLLRPQGPLWPGLVALDRVK